MIAQELVVKPERGFPFPAEFSSHPGAHARFSNFGLWSPTNNDGGPGKPRNVARTLDVLQDGDGADEFMAAFVLIAAHARWPSPSQRLSASNTSVLRCLLIIQFQSVLETQVVLHWKQQRLSAFFSVLHVHRNSIVILTRNLNQSCQV